jgi:EAL domain-containing protein (putative c-di-GMP-specific phosphodiesterase class I)
MQRLVEALTASIDPVLLTRRIAEQTCLFVPKASGAGICFCTPDDHLATVSAHGSLAPQLGRVERLSGSFQASALQSRRAEIVNDAWIDTRLVPALQARAAELDIRSWVAIPLYHDDTALGVLSVVATEAFAFDEVDVDAITSLSRLVSALIGSHSQLSRLLHDLYEDFESTSDRRATTRFLAALLIPERADQDDLHDGLDSMLAAGSLRPVFQPIVDLRSAELVAVEGLCRFPGAGDQDAGQWFSSARRLGRGVDLELRALHAVLEDSAAFPAGTPIAVNLSPTAALDVDIQQILMTCERKLVVEITEHEPFPHDLRDGLEPLRRRGIQVAVDDAGAGYSNLNQILRLQPDIVKIDGELTRGIEDDPVRRALTFSIVQLAQELGARTIAESIEGAAQQYVLRGLGIHYGQGFHLGRPAPAQQIVAELGLSA